MGFLLLAVVLTAMVFFRLRMQGALGYLKFGVNGLSFFRQVFPWRTTMLALTGLVGGSYLLKKHDKSYKVSLGWLLIGVVVTVFGLGMLIDRAGVNERLRELKPMEKMYEMRFKTESWLVGEVIELGENEAIVLMPDGEEVMVSWSGETKGMVEDVKEGDKIRVIGKDVEGVFEAEGVVVGGMRWSPMPRKMKGRPGVGPGMLRMK